MVEWSLFGVGPYCGSLLGQLGADVIKVEPAPDGDPQKFVPPGLNGVGCLYVALNTNKRSIMVNLRSADGVELMWRLIERADVLFNNFRNGTADRLGFSFEEVRERNSAIVYAECSGWGDRGPLAGSGGNDPTVQAVCGWSSVMGTESGPGEFYRFSGHIDKTASLYTSAAIVTALYRRRRTGRAQQVKLSMLEAALSMQSTRLAEYLATGDAPRPLGSASAVIAPSQAFRCLDREYVAVSTPTEAQWRRLCGVIGRVDLLEEERFATNSLRVAHRAELAEELAEVFATRPVPWWTHVLDKAHVPNSSFWNLETVKYHPLVRENGHLVRVPSSRSGRVWVAGTPWKFEHTRVCVTRSVYTDEDADEIRAELERVPPRAQPSTDATGSATDLEGLRVLELCSGISGPYCGALFADGGAQVRKIEVGDGDYTRGWGPPFAGDAGVAFTELNRNKEGLRLDALDVEGEPLARLLAEADVILRDEFDESGQRSQPSAELLRRLNPDAVICSFSAYGGTGLGADVPGDELTVQARSQVWAGLGNLGEEPVRVGADHASMLAGIAGYQATLAALLHRAESGRGEMVAVSALGAMLAIKAASFTAWSNPDEWPGFHLSAWTDPAWSGYKTADGHVWVIWSRAKRGGGRVESSPREMADEFARAVAELGATVPAQMVFGVGGWDPRSPAHPRWHDFWDEVFAGHTTEVVSEVLYRHGAEVFPFLDYAGVDRHPQMAALEPFVPLTGSVPSRRVVRAPWRIDGETRRHRMLAVAAIEVAVE